MFNTSVSSSTPNSEQNNSIDFYFISVLYINSFKTTNPVMIFLLLCGSGECECNKTKILPGQSSHVYTIRNMLKAINQTIIIINITLAQGHELYFKVRISNYYSSDNNVLMITETHWLYTHTQKVIYDQCLHPKEYNDTEKWWNVMHPTQYSTSPGNTLAAGVCDPNNKLL